MELFKGQSLLEFTERFKTDLDCEEYIASLKWEDGYCCRKLRGIYSWGSEFNIDHYLAEYSFRINRSQSKETIFNKLKEKQYFGLPKFKEWWDKAAYAEYYLSECEYEGSCCPGYQPLSEE